MIQLTPDSGPWPCSYASAKDARFSLIEDITPPLPVPPQRPGIKIGEAELQVHELQDLSECIGELVSMAVDYGIKFNIRIELGNIKPASGDLVKEINQILSQISQNIELR